MEFTAHSGMLAVRFRRDPYRKALHIDMQIVHRHLCRFREQAARIGPDRLATQFFRSRDSYLAGYLLFKHLADITNHGASHSLAENLGKMWRRERMQETYSWRPEGSTAAVFEALCVMLHSRAFDCSHHIFKQLARFLADCFSEMTEDDPDEGARCLVALDELRRDMSEVIEALARDGPALEEVFTEAPYIIDHLSSSTQRHIQRLLGFSSWDRFRRHPSPLRRNPRLLREIPLHREGPLRRENALLGGPSGSRSRLLRALTDNGFHLASAPENGQYLQLNCEKRGRGTSPRLSYHRPRGLLPGGLSGALLEYDSDCSDEGLGISAWPYRDRLRGGWEDNGDYLGELPYGRRKYLSGYPGTSGLLGL